jgi:hypothetical protein
MSSVSLEAFDVAVRGKHIRWIIPSQDYCALPHGFQDQILSGNPSFQNQILLLSKQDSKAWLISHSWDMTFILESSSEWSLLLSVIQHLKKPLLIVATPKCTAPIGFWQKCNSMSPSPTCVVLRDLESGQQIQQFIPHHVFFPRLDLITDTQFMKLPSQFQLVQPLDLRSLYRDLRGAGASLCLSLIDSRFATSSGTLPNGTTNGPNGMPSYSATWFYPENNGALRLHLSDLRMILRTVTERLAEP